MKDLFKQLFEAFKSDFKSAALALLVVVVAGLGYKVLDQQNQIIEIKEQQRLEEQEENEMLREEVRLRTDMLLSPLIQDVERATKRVDTVVDKINKTQ